MKNSDDRTSDNKAGLLGLMLFMCILMMCVTYKWGKEDGRAEAAQREAVRQEVREAEIQRERLMMQAGCNGDRVKSAVFSEMCRINDANLGGNR